jgi:hypothetical protein
MRSLIAETLSANCKKKGRKKFKKEKVTNVKGGMKG